MYVSSVFSAGNETNPLRFSQALMLPMTFFFHKQKQALHDVVDPVLQATKVAAYSKRETLSMILFALFALLWFSTRLVYFPLRVIQTCVYDRVEIFQRQGVVDDRLEKLFRVFIGCLWVLYILHWIWFYNIVVLIVKVAKGDNVKDTRSEDEQDDDDDDEEEEEEAGEKSGKEKEETSTEKLMKEETSCAAAKKHD